jgi:hypothetical protein
VNDVHAVIDHVGESGYENVCQYQKHERIAIKGSERIDDAQCDAYEEVAHFAHWHRYSTVAQDAEYGEQSERETHFELSGAEQEADEKVDDIEQQEGEQEIAVPSQRIVQTPHYEDDRREVYTESQAEFGNAFQLGYVLKHGYGFLYRSM